MTPAQRRLSKLEQIEQPADIELNAALEAMRGQRPDPEAPDQLAARIANLRAQVAALDARHREVPRVMAGLLGMLECRQRMLTA